MLNKPWMKQSVLSVTAMSMLLAGCAASQGTDSSSPQASSSDKPVTIKLHTWNNLKTDGFDVVIQEFEKKYPNIKVEFVSQGDNNSTEAMKKVDLAAASGESLDVIMIQNRAAYAQRIALNMFEPLDEYMSKEGIQFDNEYKVDTKLNGKYYGIPGKSVSWFVVINENHLKEAGLPVPKDWTWDEFLDYAKKMTKLDGGAKHYGTHFHTWTVPYTNLGQYNRQENSNLVTDDLKSANVMNPVMRKSLEIRKQAEKDQSATPYAEVISQKMNYRPQYFNQAASMLATGTFLIAETGGTDAVPANFKTVFAPYPKLNKEDPIASPFEGDILAVYGKSKHKQEAYTFIRWFTTEGITLQGRYIPSWKKANLDEVIDKIVSKTKTPEQVDKESLLYVLKNTTTSKSATPIPYQAEVEKVMQEEFDKMLLKDQDIDTTQKNAQERIQKLIDANKK
ncbi:ABC transporter substrate-binding protein [Paenibacillus puerhi]|uniref:ABC transporter substrate-binding protein n=1 Tax=Paenibacillus puerhi TaxID=2692622 RepID=UPI00135678B4|nr:extracellular solute-binding protein [Paenibacillus puerhi]